METIDLTPTPDGYRMMLRRIMESSTKEEDRIWAEQEYRKVEHVTEWAPRSSEPEWDTCEDCLGTGGHRTESGEGSCGACGGSGRLPANEQAHVEKQQAAEQREIAAFRQAERDLDDR